MLREIGEIEPKIIGEIYNLVNPLLNPNKQNELLGITRSWGTQRRHLLNTLQETSNLTACTVADVEYGQSLISDIGERRSLTEDFIYHPKSYWYKGMFGAQLGRLQVTLGMIQEHPWLSPLTAERDTAEAFLSEANERLLAAQKSVRNIFQPQISETQKGLIVTQNRLLNFAEGVAMNSLETSKKYVRILPARSGSLAEKYGQTFGLDPKRMMGMNEFLEYIIPFIDARKKDKNYRQITGNDILNNIVSLPEPIKRRLQVWSSYQFSLLLAGEGLIPKPELPDIFQSIKI